MVVKSLEVDVGRSKCGFARVEMYLSARQPSNAQDHAKNFCIQKVLTSGDENRGGG